MICSRCIYDDHIPYITFDPAGVCNYCRQHDQLEKEYPTGEEGSRRLQHLAEKIKRAGRNKRYDVVVGVSGGTDSSYLLYLAKKLGLRPLAAHFDNTWNSKIAVENIHGVLKALQVDLFTHVVDNREFCDLFKSFLKASVPDIDTPSDIGLATTHYLAAEKYGIKYIFEGHSFRTEGISPHGWFYMDAKYIETVQSQFGSYKIETFPNLWMMRWLKWTAVDRIKKIRPLYYIDYQKEETKQFLNKEYGWKWYGGHHMENRTAYFTNNYYLPRKFGIDLRYSEFSALVRSGQMTRSQALEKIKEPKPFDPTILEEMKKRLDLKDEEFDRLMNLPRKTYKDYQTYKETFERMRWFFWVMYRFNLVPKSFYMKYTQRYDNR
ncbi:N-acetyl sugar amidotransferase [Candidatus Manganitrophus noduliformans]|uniref:N-acetyl sugar amidotransferase n=1 Tax=Candidatus Manganitrophus noduliformans TaxID=2606439 RepID=A0A7X6IAU7_9BACT|nr:N-acetyl sugar amidotransferase [Candidatus Manganitrophus noduliformans]NKE71096.1 N-acetyl sugar amidotransferase [Candidatus Manganitrophus noduliformans]